MNQSPGTARIPSSKKDGCSTLLLQESETTVLNEDLINLLKDQQQFKEADSHEKNTKVAQML